MADPRQNRCIGKVFELAEPHFAAIWNAISAFKRLFPIATKTAIATKPHFESLLNECPTGYRQIELLSHFLATNDPFPSQGYTLRIHPFLWLRDPPERTED